MAALARKRRRAQRCLCSSLASGGQQQCRASQRRSSASSHRATRPSEASRSGSVGAGSFTSGIAAPPRTTHAPYRKADPLIAICGGGVNLFNSQGDPRTTEYLTIIGELDVDLRSTIAAEARAKSVYERLPRVHLESIQLSSLIKVSKSTGFTR
jgi:Manganese containing catalase